VPEQDVARPAALLRHVHGDVRVAHQPVGIEVGIAGEDDSGARAELLLFDIGRMFAEPDT